MAKIYDSDDVRYYYERGEIAFWEKEQIYYDPENDLYYNRSGDRQRVHEWFKKPWFLGARFRYWSGDPCYLPEQDPSRRDERSERRKPDRRERISDFVNFIVLDTMAMCGKTDFNENQTPITSWEKQQPCNFAVKSVVAPNCMYWDPKIDGHCSCFEAYDDARGKSVSLDRIEGLKRIRTEDVDLEAGFEEIKKFTIDELSILNRNGGLPLVIRGNLDGANVFYHKELDVYIDGRGKPLKEMTQKRRLQDAEYAKFAHNWTGPIEMKKCEGMEPILSAEMQLAINEHERLHKLAEKCYFDEDDLKQDVGCEYYPNSCAKGCHNAFCKYQGFKIDDL